MTQSRTGKVLALSLGSFLTQVVGLVSTAVLARYLTMDDYATYRQVLLTYGFAAPLLTLALPDALYWFLPKAPASARRVLFENLILLTAMGAVLSLFLALGGAGLLAARFHNPGLEPALRLFIPYPLITFPAAAVSACLVIQNRIRLLTVFNVLSRLGLGVTLIAVCAAWPTPQALVLATVGVAMLTGVAAVHLMWRACPGSALRPDRSSMFEMLKYAVPLGVASMVGTVTLQLDKVIVSSLCTPEAFAIYSNGAIELPLVDIVTGSLTTVVLAEMASLYAQNRQEEALDLFRKAAGRAAAILLPAMLFLLVAARPFIETLYSSKYLESVWPFVLYLLIMPVRIVAFGAALRAAGLTRVILRRSLGELALNAVLCVVFVSWIGYLGAVVATLLTLYLYSVPFNIHAIGRGFATHWTRVLPYGELGRIFGVGLLFLPLAVLPAHAGFLPPAVQLGLAAVLYWPATLVLLVRTGRLPLPPQIAGLIPETMRPLIQGR